VDITIRVTFLIGLAFLGVVSVAMGVDAYEAGFTWIGAAILGGAIFLALGHVWEKTTGVRN
jgi:hypothetical protein